MEKYIKYFRFFIIPQTFHIQPRRYIQHHLEKSAKSQQSRLFEHCFLRDSFGHRLCVETTSLTASPLILLSMLIESPSKTNRHQTEVTTNGGGACRYRQKVHLSSALSIASGDCNTEAIFKCSASSLLSKVFTTDPIFYHHASLAQGLEVSWANPKHNFTHSQL